MFSFLSRGLLNYIAEHKMLLRQLNLPLRMDTTSTHDERQFSIGAANMPVPYHLDESDSDSIVSSEDASYTELITASVPMTNCGPKEEVKLGLVNAIRSRRVAQGLDEMPAMEPKKPRIESLTFEEQEKRRIRRERNKLAAFKCRQRRKEHLQKLQDESDELNNERSALERELLALRAQKEQLETMFQAHKCFMDGTKTKDGKQTTEIKSEVQSSHSCSVEVKTTKSPTSSSPDSVKA